MTSERRKHEPYLHKRGKLIIEDDVIGNIAKEGISSLFLYGRGHSNIMCDKGSSCMLRLPENVRLAEWSFHQQKHPGSAGYNLEIGLCKTSSLNFVLHYNHFSQLRESKLV